MDDLLKSALTDEQVKRCLCIHDKRYPDYRLYHDPIDEPTYEPGINCSCDSCHYGKHKLAVEILRLRELLGISCMLGLMTAETPETEKAFEVML